MPASLAWRWLPLHLLASLVAGLTVDTSSSSSIDAAASNMAWNMMRIYFGNQTGNTPGNLPSPYYWWEAGGMFAHLVDYWYYTGDTTYNQDTIQAIVWQAGNTGFMPPNQTKDEGNDDQVFWAFTAMEAAELNFPAPSTGPAAWVQNAPSWVGMAQAVFNLQITRWTDGPGTCGGGLRWQIYEFNDGYDYQNMAANGGFFQLAARLARYTGNATYLQWAEKEWAWLLSTPLVNSSDWSVADGMNVGTCDNPNTQDYTYNYGLLIGGLAYLYDHTKNASYLEPLQGILNKTYNTFFPWHNDIISEVICEPSLQCDADATTFKSFTLRWMAVTTQLVPSLADQIRPYLEASAKGAAGQCDGSATVVGEPETEVCGMSWDTTTWDQTYGPGQQMSALAAVGANQIQLKNLAAPLSLSTGGTSKSDPSAGTGGSAGGGASSPGAVYTDPITTGDRAGAGILTAIVLAALLGGAFWLVHES